MENRLTYHEYCEIRRDRELNFKLCWQFFQDTKGTKYPDIDLPEFNLVFREFVLHKQWNVFHSPYEHVTKIFELDVMLDKIFNFYDKYYESFTEDIDYEI